MCKLRRWHYGLLLPYLLASTLASGAHLFLPHSGRVAEAPVRVHAPDRDVAEPTCTPFQCHGHSCYGVTTHSRPSQTETGRQDCVRAPHGCSHNCFVCRHLGTPTTVGSAPVQAIAIVCSQRGCDRSIPWVASEPRTSITLRGPPSVS